MHVLIYKEERGEDKPDFETLVPNIMSTSFSVLCWGGCWTWLEIVVWNIVKIWTYSCGSNLCRRAWAVGLVFGGTGLDTTTRPWASWQQQWVLNGFCRKVGTVSYLTPLGEVSCLSFSDCSQSIIVTWIFSTLITDVQHFKKFPE